MEPLTASFLHQMSRRVVIIVLRLLFWVGVPVILLILPETYFDTGTSLCPSMLFLGEECPGCGMTRACMHLIHFGFDDAFDYNMLSFIVFPILAFLWAKWFWKDVQLLLAERKRTEQLF
ncbi:MAG: DUF2752 domain-containing protein [Chitinophagales bacterium]|nr:DUF2752 domain-containing protein [Chitinophagales bacterium]